MVNFRKTLLLGAFCLASLGASAQDSWVIGQSAPLSGGNARFGNDVRDAAMAMTALINDGGGVAGRALELVTLDDTNDRKKAAANTTVLL